MDILAVGLDQKLVPESQPVVVLVAVGKLVPVLGMTVAVALELELGSGSLGKWVVALELVEPVVGQGPVVPVQVPHC